MIVQQVSHQIHTRIDAAGYWKFINGPEYSPPNIPELKTSTQVKGLNDQGQKRRKAG